MANGSDKSQELEAVTENYRRHNDETARRLSLPPRSGKRLSEITAEMKARNDRLEQKLKES